MNSPKVWLNIAVLSGLLASLPAMADKGKEPDEKPTYRSTIQFPAGQEND